MLPESRPFDPLLVLLELSHFLALLFDLADFIVHEDVETLELTIQLLELSDGGFFELFVCLLHDLGALPDFADRTQLLLEVGLGASYGRALGKVV